MSFLLQFIPTPLYQMFPDQTYCLDAPGICNRRSKRLNCWLHWQCWLWNHCYELLPAQITFQLSSQCNSTMYCMLCCAVAVSKKTKEKVNSPELGADSWLQLSSSVFTLPHPIPVIWFFQWFFLLSRVYSEIHFLHIDRWLLSYIKTISNQALHAWKQPIESTCLLIDIIE